MKSKNYNYRMIEGGCKKTGGHLPIFWEREGRTWLKEDGKKGLKTELRWEKIWSNSAEMGKNKVKENLIYGRGGDKKAEIGGGGVGECRTYGAEVGGKGRKY
jgi:hypothetical protein